MSCGIQLPTIVGGTIVMATTVCEARARYIPFLFTATTNGENVFPFDDTPIDNSVVVNIDGMSQSPLNSDFSVSGTSLTVPDLDIGDNVYGYYAI